MAVKMPLGLRIAIIDRAFRRKMDEWAEEIGITAVQLRVLGEVSLMEDNGVEEVNQKDLEHIEQVTHPTMTGIIKRLEAKGFLICAQVRMTGVIRKYPVRRNPVEFIRRLRRRKHWL